MEESESLLPCILPASIGPPETKAAGMFSRTAASSMPGTILSQLPTNTMPEKACARARISALSAMTSREGSE